MFESKERVIKIVGEALNYDGSNGKVDVYPYLGCITLRNMGNKESFWLLEAKVNLLDRKIDALLAYLKLEYSDNHKPIVRKIK